jgi:DNA-binding GntR family transcriptional regulator
LGEKFELSRSPVREGLIALEKEGTLIVSPYKCAIVKPLSEAEVLDIAELRLALISLVLKPAYRHLSPADFDYAYDLAKRLTRINNAKELAAYVVLPTYSPRTFLDPFMWIWPWAVFAAILTLLIVALVAHGKLVRY